MADDSKLRYLLTKATRDLEFREAFLKNPEEVAEKAQVKLTRDQLEKIKSVAVLIEELDKIRIPPGPIVYPIDDTVIHWKVHELAEVLRYYYRPPKYVFYPAYFFRPGDYLEDMLSRVGRRRYR